MAQLFWHHVLGPRFQLIFDSGTLLPDPRTGEEEVAVVWFARDRAWDKKMTGAHVSCSVDAFYSSYRDRVADREGQLARIGVLAGAAPNTWLEYLQLLGRGGRFDVVPTPTAARVAGFGGGIKNLRFSSETVSRESWEAVEVWRNGTWVSIRSEGRLS